MPDGEARAPMVVRKKSGVRRSIIHYSTRRHTPHGVHLVFVLIANSYSTQHANAVIKNAQI